ncbi:hybrid sensor histidine kinase/response regulator [Desulfobulbus elongatus]|uniref:hybrid sensor histidine kinase/response regulator n=1 Tax=Desulfobulbus elongatus TaxID=53332 RepID=UPI000552AB70|nr:response regulator [Desulfobulbus elongatus]
MIEPQLSPPPSAVAEDELLDGDECIVIVDDFPDIVGLVQDFLGQRGLATVNAGSADALRRQLAERKVALVLLDIGLPDADGTTLLPELKRDDPDLAVIMLTAVTDLQTALACLRYGADDYLTKPVRFTDLLTTVHRVLEKRRLTIRNRLYQRQIEQATFRIRLAHALAVKMNTAYLSTTELDEILHAILVGITAQEGLQFNRAFLALFDESGILLEGRLAIGPGSRDDSRPTWPGLAMGEGELPALASGAQAYAQEAHAEINRIVRALRVEARNSNHILIRAVRDRQPINVIDGQCTHTVPLELLGLLQEDSFVVVPLFSPSRALGVIIADHFVSRAPIDEVQIHALESFASQASLAIEHCRLYMAMQRKIKELEEVTSELQKNKDLLVETERYSALGHMAAQLAHSIRNPITAIGGTARLLARKIDNPEWLQFLSMMAGEAEKIEKTLEDLFNFVERSKPVLERTHLLPLIRKALLLHFNALNDRKIRKTVLFPEHDPLVKVDPRQIQQALVHLIRNSIEAMPQGGELTVEVVEKEEQVVIILTDTGLGMNRENIGHATDPFYTTKIIGTGMGLALVRRIVEDHAGELVLESEDNGGMQARIVLPSASR